MMIWKNCPDKIVLTCAHVDVSLIHLILLLAINCAAVGKFHSFAKETQIDRDIWWPYRELKYWRAKQ
jgi:hypothetical protein